MDTVVALNIHLCTYQGNLSVRTALSNPRVLDVLDSLTYAVGDRMGLSRSDSLLLALREPAVFPAGLNCLPLSHVFTVLSLCTKPVCPSSSLPWQGVEVGSMVHSQCLPAIVTAGDCGFVSPSA